MCVYFCMYSYLRVNTLKLNTKNIPKDEKHQRKFANYFKIQIKS